MLKLVEEDGYFSVLLRFWTKHMHHHTIKNKIKSF